jgi:plastocyanin
MSFKTVRRVAVAFAALALVGVPAAGSSADTADRRAPKFVKVADDFFSPASTSVPRGRVVRWVWSPANDNAHNVRLRRGPSGVDRSGFRSASRRVNYTFQRRLRRPGRYVFVCSFHAPGMRQVIRVRR